MASKTLSDGRKVLVGSKADPDSKKYLQASGGKSVQLADGTQLNAEQSKNYGETPTVISSSNITENKIPELKTKASKLPGGIIANEQEKQEEETGSNFDEYSLTGDSGKPEDSDPILDRQMKLLDKQKKLLDRNAQQQISSVQERTNSLMAEQRMINAAKTSGVKGALMRGGTGGAFRYSPNGAFGAVAGEATSGIRALSELASKEAEIISGIKADQAANDFKAMQEKFDLLDGVRQERSDATTKLNEKIREQEIQSSRDDALAGLIEQGITSPVQLLNLLNYDEAGNKIGDWTLSEITGSLKGINDLAGSGIGDTGFKLDNKAVGILLGNGMTTVDIKAMQDDLKSGASIDDILGGLSPELQKVVKGVFGVEEAVGDEMVTPGAGATTELDERAIRSRLEPKLMGILNKGAVSDEDRKYVREQISYYRDAGMNEQQILDVFSGWSADVASPYNGSFRDIILANDVDGTGTSPALTRVGALLESKNYPAAMNAVENMAMDNARKLDPDGYMGTATAEAYGNKVKRLKELFKKAEDLVGPIQGSYQNALGRFRGKEATELRGAITDLVADMRNGLSGTAVTESESSFLEPLIASLENTEGAFGSKINSIENRLLDQYNSTRSSVSLPTVNLDQATDRNKRLPLYSGNVYSRNVKTLEI